MSRRKQNVVPVVPPAVPEVKAEVESKAASDDGGEERDREIIRAFMEVSPLFAEVLERQVDLASRRWANEPDSHFEIGEEVAAWRRYRKQIQEIVGHFQGLKKLTDKRLKGLREAQRWFDSLGG